MIDRPRLLAIVAGRFERRITTVAAGPGFGKTALLTSALADNELQPNGVDVWMQCQADDAGVGELARRLLAALGQAGPATVETIADAVWSRAPDDIALVLDDVHEVAPGSPGERLIAALLVALPRNGHLLLAGRRALPLPVARLRLTAEVAELFEADLAFDDDELQRFAIRRAVAPELVASVRWPALAELVVVAGHEAATEYLWEEVLAQLDPERLELITQLAPFTTVDDALVRAVTGTDHSAHDLFGDLPLTVRTPDGALRLHTLWEPVLRRRLDSDTERRMLIRGASHLLERGDVRRAFTASTAACDLEGQRAATRAAMAMPLARTRLEDLRFLVERLPSGPDLDVEAALLRAILALEGVETIAMQQFEDAAELARDRGDAELECIALWRLYQSELWAGHPERIPAIIGRSSELARQGVALAQLLVEIQSSVEFGRQGRRDDALRMLRASERRGPELSLAQTIDLRDGVLVDLGCPEEVRPSGVADRDLSELTGSTARVVAAHAAWLQGDVSPELAFELGRYLASGIGNLRLNHQRVALAGILALIAVHAGELDAAVDYIDQGKKFVRHIVAGHAANFLRVAEASLAVARHDERLAAALLEEALADVAIEILPPRSYLNSIVMLHALVPRVRTTIEGANFGPALTAVQDMARALTALRDRGDVAPAAALPWRCDTLIRAHIEPPHAAELAVAALVGGAAEAEPVLSQLPDVREQLRWVATRHDGSVAEFARDRLLTLPPRPSHPIRLELLGGVSLYRDGVRVVDKAWNRERVRQILCYLLTNPRTARGEVMGALWPDLDERGASANLRTNLGHLRRVLEPERDRGEASWFVRGDGEALILCHDGLESDVVRFDAIVEEARHFEERGVPGTALSRYLAAIDLYQGDYAAGFDDPWVTYERIRLRSLFVTAATRAGELLLARGEPEQALRRADQVMAVDELAERSHRLRIRCLLAIGDRSAARNSGEQLLRVLAGAGLSAEIETNRLLAPLGLAP